MGGGDSMLAPLFIGALLLLYFLPTFVAVGRRAKAAEGVFVVDLFLGWTFIGWVVALAWAVSGEKRAEMQPD